MGLTDKQISSLKNLVKSEFDYREWLALKYAQDYAILGGKESTEEYMEHYLSQYSKRERKYILRTIRQMDFVNRVSNTIFSKKRSKSCDVKAG